MSLSPILAYNYRSSLVKCIFLKRNLLLVLLYLTNRPTKINNSKKKKKTKKKKKKKKKKKTTTTTTTKKQQLGYKVWSLKVFKFLAIRIPVQTTHTTRDLC